MAEGLTINSVNMMVSGAWRVRDMSPLFAGSEQDGADVVLPGVTTGVRAQRRFKRATVVNLDLFLFGKNDAAGTPHADQRTGLYANALYLRSNLIEPTNTGDGTVTATATYPTGTITGSVHVLGPLNFVEAGPRLWKGVLRLSIPGGSLA